MTTPTAQVLTEVLREREEPHCKGKYEAVTFSEIEACVLLQRFFNFASVGSLTFAKFLNDLGEVAASDGCASKSAFARTERQKLSLHLHQFRPG